MTITPDPMPLLTDQVKAVLKKQEELVEGAFDTNAGFEQMRLNYVKERRFWNEGGPEMAKTVDEEFQGPAGSFLTRYYYPVEAEKLPVIIYIHGGGFVVGNCDTHDRVCRIIASQTGAAVVSVDYHLSPESTYPTNIQECAAVAKYLHEHGAEKGIDGEDISFAGDSGGAVLSFATNLWLRDEEGDNSYVKTMLLYYGYYGLKDSPSRRLFGWEIDGMREEDLVYYNAMWLGDNPMEKPELMDLPYVNMLARDLTFGIPDCFIASAGLDPLRDDSLVLHEALDVLGVRNQYVNYEGVLHAFVHWTRMCDEANACLEASAEFWKAQRQ